MMQEIVKQQMFEEYQETLDRAGFREKVRRFLEEHTKACDSDCFVETTLRAAYQAYIHALNIKDPGLLMYMASYCTAIVNGYAADFMQGVQELHNQLCQKGYEKMIGRMFDKEFGGPKGAA